LGIADAQIDIQYYRLIMLALITL